MKVPNHTMQWKIAAPVERWDEALPLGNGITGVLLWGDSNRIKLSLDRGDLWDERTDVATRDPDWNRAALEEIVATRDQGRLRRLDELHEKIQATKLPVGRLELTFKKNVDVREFLLDMRTAAGRVLDENGKTLLECFCAADMSGIHLRIADALDAEVRIVPPDYRSTETKADQGFVKSAASLGYPPPESFSSPEVQYYVQPCQANLFYGIFVVRNAPCEWSVFIRRAESREEIARMTEGYRRAFCRQPEFAEAFEKHRRWWRRFWRRSQVNLGDAVTTRYYHFCRYLYGSGSRVGAPPMPLQGVWTADDNTLPPWKGDYHHDLNTEMNYIAYLTSGDFDCGESFLNHLSGQIDVYRKFAGEFFGVSGVAVPGTATLAGQSLGGWMQYSMSPTNSAWLATLFADHYRYTRDRTFLVRKAVPFISGVGEFIRNLLREEPSGKYVLPLSTSPEIHDAALDAFLPSTSNYDLALIRRLFSDLRDICLELEEPQRAAEWEACLDKLPDLAVDSSAGLMICPGELLQESHRHHSHLMAIYPLRLLDPARDAGIIEKSWRHLDQLGTGLWTGFGFAWAGAMAAYCGNAGRAYRMLKIFLDGFISRNGFHLNGDYKNYGYCWWKYRPFTVETNFLAMQIVHEMLLQSFRGEFKIFPAVPDEWPDVEFERLRGESGMLVSAKMTRGRVRFVKLEATVDCRITLHNPAGRGENLNCSRGELFRGSDVCVLNLKSGEIITFSAAVSPAN